MARDCMAPSYPELADGLRPDRQYAYGEEDAFLATLRRAPRSSTPRSRETKSAGGRTLSGDKAFQLHDTYGFPIDLTLEIGRGAGPDRRPGRVPPADDRAAQPGQGRRARRARPATPTCPPTATVLDAGGPVEFTGYPEIARESRVRALLSGGGVGLTAAGEGDDDRAGARRRPRSTPRAAASSPTPASSPSATAGSRSSTCSRRCPA